MSCIIAEFLLFSITPACRRITPVAGVPGGFGGNGAVMDLLFESFRANMGKKSEYREKPDVFGKIERSRR
jgi:hypothetical protein